MRIRIRLIVNRNADAERFKAGIGTQMRKMRMPSIETLKRRGYKDDKELKRR
jgi:hypothetical protein